MRTTAWTQPLTNGRYNGEGGEHSSAAIFDTRTKGAAARHHHRQPLRQLQSGKRSTPCKKTPRRERKNKIALGLVPRYLIPHFPCYVDVWRGRDHLMRELVGYQTSRIQFGKHSDVSRHLVEEPGKSHLRRRVSFVLQEALSFRTRHHLWRHELILAGSQQLRPQDRAPV